MKNILFIASLNTDKEQYDGERIKSTFMYDAFCDLSNVKVINLSKHKVVNTLKILLVAIFKKKKYDKIVISKDPHGANIIMKILRFGHFPLNKIIYFEIGPFLYDRIIAGSIKKDTFLGIDIVVETNSMKEELLSLGFKSIDVFPNFKPIIDIQFKEEIYPKETLKLVYFSRVSEMKGIYDLISAVEEANKMGCRFTLDIYGRFETKSDEKRINKYCLSNLFVKYNGKINVSNKTGYQILSSYDLHVFPTKYSEGFPGTIIDFFIAGVPTLSSTFLRSSDILSDCDSFFFERENIEDLVKKLVYIYNHQQELGYKRISSYKRRDEFSTLSFKQYANSKLLLSTK